MADNFTFISRQKQVLIFVEAIGFPLLADSSNLNTAIDLFELQHPYFWY
jgi:hypothetical protein